MPLRIQNSLLKVPSTIEIMGTDRILFIYFLEALTEVNEQISLTASELPI